MNSELINLYGPFSINKFGLMIILGLILFSILFLRDPRCSKLMSVNEYYNYLSLAIIIGFLGARLLFIVVNWQEFDSWWQVGYLWQGGFSILGGLIALLISFPLIFYRQGVPLLPVLDLVSTYIPLLLSVSRLGCYWAGCCYGLTTNFFSTSSLSACFARHPTQLYSALGLMFIFILLHYTQTFFTTPGYQFCLFMLLLCTERFLVDFLRADQEFIGAFNLLSIAQITCIIIGAATFSYMLAFSRCLRL